VRLYRTREIHHLARLLSRMTKDLPCPPDGSSIGCARKVRFAIDSLLEGEGFEPSAFCPESSGSAAFRASVAANLHPYSAQICTPVSTESCDLKLSTWVDCGLRE
jgi:hypothetical protein